MSEETVCSACGRGMSLKDLENKSFREVQGRLYCPECVLKMGHPKRMRCPHCGAETTAVLHDGKYTCTHCGEQIGGRQESGVITSARPAGSRKPAEDTAAARSPSAFQRRKARTVQVLAVLLSGFIAGTLVLGALVVRACVDGRPAPPPTSAAASNETPGDRETPAETRDKEVFDFVQKWVQSGAKHGKDEIKIYEEAAAGIASPVLRAKAKLALAGVEKKYDQTVNLLRRKNTELAARLTAAQVEIARLRKPAESPPAPPERPAKPPPQPEPPKPGESQAETRDREAQAAWKTAFADAQRRVAERKYGLAMRALKAVVDEHGETEWGRKADAERRRIRSDAYEEFRKLSSKADVLVRLKRDHAGARELYARALGFGVPALEQIVQQKLAQLRAAEGREPRTAAPDRRVPAAVKQQIDALTKGGAAEREGAALALGNLGDKAAVPHLIAALKGERWLVRSRAALSLGRLGDLRAVAALVKALDDEKDTVRFDAHGALKALTKQTFGEGEKAKWVAWAKANPAESVPVPKPGPPSEGTTFNSRVLGVRYDTDVVTFVVPDGTVLAPNVRVRIMKDRKRVCDALISQVAKGEAYGKIEALQPGAGLQPGDEITVRLPK